jgi:hypothetical protein
VGGVFGSLNSFPAVMGKGLARETSLFYLKILTIAFNPSSFSLSWTSKKIRSESKKLITKTCRSCFCWALCERFEAKKIQSSCRHSSQSARMEQAIDQCSFPMSPGRFVAKVYCRWVSRASSYTDSTHANISAGS